MIIQNTASRRGAERKASGLTRLMSLRSKRISVAACVLVVVLNALGVSRGAEIKYFDQIGTYNIPDSDEKIVVTAEGPRIQFRIRSSGPMDPQIKATDPWFIAMVDQDSYWVYLGGDRFFHYSWPSKTSSRIDEWHYPRDGKERFPSEVIAYLQSLQKRKLPE